MTVDLILHGVPNGQDIWGVKDDTHYFSTFYVQKDEREMLSIEVRKVAGKSYCYYNYLKYNGVIASDKRAGSYFGITLRFDAYYKDIVNIYHVCEIIYNNLADAIFVKNGDNIRFKISRFTEMDNELIEIKKKTINLINLSVASRDFAPINDSFFKNDSKIIKAFLLDCTPDNVMQALLKYGKVEVSKHHTSINETKKLKGVEERFNTTITQKDKELLSAHKQCEDLQKEQDKLRNELEYANGEIRRLNGIISEKDGVIKENEETVTQVAILKKEAQQLKNNLQEKLAEVDRLKNKLNKYKDNRQISDLVKEIKAPLHTLATVAGRQLTRFPDNNSTHTDEDLYPAYTKRKCYDKKINLFGLTSVGQIVTMVLLVFILCCSIFCVSKINSLHKIEAKSEATEKTIFIEQADHPVELNNTDDSEDANNDDTINNE